VSEGLVMEFEGCGRDECEYVTAQLGVDPDAEAPGWPPVLLFHTAGATTSRWIVFEIWESRDAHQLFTNERLAPVPVIAGFPGSPNRVEWIDLSAFRALWGV